MPKVSVVVPIYGVEKYLRQCVDSILSQTLKDIEVILVDDGSPDGCPAIVDEYAKRDSRVVAIHQLNGGYGRAVNHGIEQAKGEYIGIVESDDWIEPEMYERLYVQANHDDLDVMKSNFTPIFLGNRFLKSCPNVWREAPAENCVLSNEEAAVFLYYHPSIWTCIYKREFFESNQIEMAETKGASWQDNLFQVQTLCLASRIGFTKCSYYNYRIFSYSPSEALKNWRIPFERTAEIHEWMKEKGFCRSPFISWLGRRELVYLFIVAGMKKLDDEEGCMRAIKKMANKLPIEEMLRDLPVNKRKRVEKDYEMAKLSPRNFRRRVCRSNMMIGFNAFRRWCFSVRIKSRQFRITVLGRTFQLI